MEQNVILYLFMVTVVISQVSCNLEFVPKSITISSGECEYANLKFTKNCPNNATVVLQPEFVHIATPYPVKIKVNSSECKPWPIQICGHDSGIALVKAVVLHATIPSCYLHITVGKLYALTVLSDVVGWIYFFAWGISFYPQIFDNYSHKSVVGLNFDFLALNIVGFISYSFYNIGLHFVPYIQDEYKQKYPSTANPVQLTDVFFSVHGIWACIIVIIQCFMYERNDQKVSLTARFLLCLFSGYILVIGVCAYTSQIDWLDFLYYCSYIKLLITLVKYTPQALMNYRRQSTEGWSIGNVLLDVVGGFFSMLQMIINGYNYDDWNSILNDPTKFGLGFFSIGFDAIFIYQHYVLYRIKSEKKMTAPTNVGFTSDSCDGKVPLHI